VIAIRSPVAQSYRWSRLAGISEVIRVPHGDCANAVGAATAQISGETDQVNRDLSRADAIAAAEAQAVARATEAGADQWRADFRRHGKWRGRAELRPFTGSRSNRTAGVDPIHFDDRGAVISHGLEHRNSHVVRRDKAAQ
jgi:hypothetical protein